MHLLHYATGEEALAGGDQWCPWLRQEHLGQETVSRCVQEHIRTFYRILFTSMVVKLRLRDLTPLVQELSLFGLKQLMELFESVGQMERVVHMERVVQRMKLLVVLISYDTRCL